MAIHFALVWVNGFATLLFVAAHITMQDDFPWYFYAFMVGFIAVLIWLGYRAGVAAWMLLKFAKFQMRLQTGPPASFSFAVWKLALFWIALFFFGIIGTRIIVRANFCSFQRLDISDSSVQLNYELKFIKHELPLSSVRSIEMVPFKHQRFGLKITTANGEIYRSMDSDDEAVISDCGKLVENFKASVSSR